MIKEKTKPAPLRLKISEMRDLKREARSEFMTLAGYLRKLVITHPSRIKVK
jgi:hypothetical protein